MKSLFKTLFAFTGIIKAVLRFRGTPVLCFFLVEGNSLADCGMSKNSKAYDALKRMPLPQRTLVAFIFAAVIEEICPEATSVYQKLKAPGGKPN